MWFYWQGLAYLQLEDWSAAQQSFYQGLTGNPRSILNLAGICQAMIQRDSLSVNSSYWADFQRHQKHRTTEAEYLAVANTYWLLGQEDVAWQGEAKRILYQARTRFPSSHRADWELAQAYLQRKQYELAANHFYAVLERKPDYAPAFLGLAQVDLQNEQYPRAADWIQQSLKLDPDLAEAYRYRAELWLRADQLEKAQQDYRTYLYYTGGDARSWLYYAGALYLGHYYRDALAALDEAETDKPSLQCIRLRLKAFSWADWGRWDSAGYWLQRFQREVPESHWIPADQAYWAAWQIRQEDFSAEAGLQAAIALRPDLRVHFERLAEEALGRKDYLLAARFAERYVSSFALAPAEEWLWLAQCQYFAGDYQSAYTSVRRSRKLQSNHPKLLYWWGICSRKLGYRQEMALAFTRLIEQLEDVEAQNEQEQEYFLHACTVMALYYFQTQDQECERARTYARL
ncbi:MAG: tetratricopeptide repeat protein, partial [Bacteroidota bacterium]